VRYFARRSARKRGYPAAADTGCRQAGSGFKKPFGIAVREDKRGRGKEKVEEKNLCPAEKRGFL
jgi:hypothetical protein